MFDCWLDTSAASGYFYRSLGFEPVRHNDLFGGTIRPTGQAVTPRG